MRRLLLGRQVFWTRLVTVKLRLIEDRRFRCANNGFVFVREVGKLSPALGHCHENRGTLERYVSSLCERGAVGGACAELVRAYHGASPV